MSLIIKSRKISVTYEYPSEQIIVQGSYEKDATSGDITSISGTCYVNNGGVIGANIGNYNGNNYGGTFKYNFNDVSLSNLELIQGVALEIENEIKKVDK